MGLDLRVCLAVSQGLAELCGSPNTPPQQYLVDLYRDAARDKGTDFS